MRSRWQKWPGRTPRKPTLAVLDGYQAGLFADQADAGGGTHELKWLTAPGRRLGYSVGMTSPATSRRDS